MITCSKTDIIISCA